MLYDRPCPSLKCDQVVSDDYQGAYNAVEYLIQTGCRRVMCFTSSMQLEVSRRRYQGWRDALLNYGMPISEKTNAIISSLPERTYFNSWMRVSQLVDYFNEFYEEKYLKLLKLFFENKRN